ncbi:GntR family transcriptional regulator [Hoeflea sp. CAU 1731]
MMKIAINMPPISRQRLGDQVADVLRRQILLGQLKPGDHIHERETSAALAVSRTPLREALRLLETEGLVEMAPARSPIVAKPSLAEVTHLLLVQSALECLAGECACDEATEDEIRKIKAMHETMLATKDNPDPIEFFQVDMGFHVAIVAATKNLPLIKTHKQYHARLWRARFLSARRSPAREAAMIEHANIVEGLQRRDKEQASSGLRKHLRQAIENIKVIYALEETEDRPATRTHFTNG